MVPMTIYSCFARWVRQNPDAPAVIEENRTVSYRELDELTDRVLGKFADKSYSFIGIVMSHGIEMIAAMLAVLKSGAAYVPAEPTLPKKRIDYMMARAGVSFVITDGYFTGLPQAESFADRSTSGSPVYVLYTSGTTGKPKGVVVRNSSVVNYAEAFEAEFHVAPGDVMLQYSVCAFDIFVEEVFTTLLNGAALAIPPQSIHDGSVDDLMDFCERHGVTEISGFPYLLADMNRHRRFPSALRLLISGGDVVRESYISWLKKQDFVIYNTYGPSETTVCATYYRIDNSDALDDGTFPVGKAIKGVDVRILDADMKELPVGETGEICIFGEGVSDGYLGNPPEQSNFTVWSDGRRMYRSGDLGYVLPDGNIAFLHRRDRQVMILGKRVEPDEVENILNESPCVERGVVRAFVDESGLSYLIAYIVLSHKYCKVSGIKEFLNSKLPDYMIPEFFVKMEALPLTARGKIDNHALPVVMKEGGKV